MVINGKEYKLRYSGLTTIIFKEEFNRDMIFEANDIFKNSISIFQLIYALAKTCNPNIESFEDFMDDIDNPIELLSNKETMGEILKVMKRDGEAKKEVKKN